MKISMTMILISLTVIFWGTAPILDKAAVKRADPFLGLIVRSLSVGLIMLLVVLFSGKLKDLMMFDKKAALYYTFSGLLAGILGVFTYFKALQLSPASKIVPLSATYPLLTAVLSVYFLGESITLYRFIGIVFIIIGVWLVK